MNIFSLLSIGLMFVLFIVVSWISIRQNIKIQKKIDDATIQTYTSEETREFLAEKLGYKVSQIKFKMSGDRLQDNRFLGIVVVKEGFDWNKLDA